MKRFAAVAMLLTFLIASCSMLTAQESQNQNPAPKPEPKLTNWYKIEITLSEFEDGKKTNTRSYTLQAEENGQPAIMKLGDRVPVATGPVRTGEDDKLREALSMQFQYIDVGLNITTYVRDRQGRIGLTVSVDQSSIATPSQSVRVAPNQPIIRQLRMENTAFVTPGKSILIASVDDPGKPNHKYTADAIVTKLNP